ncbi:MAG: glycoside hydrolase family 3 N-terminal domain-containing protein [Bacteroidota bacterium]
MRRVLSLLLLLALSGASFLPGGGVRAQTPTPPVDVQRLISEMSPEERVGQLFLVSFSGTDTSSESQIYDLIANHHVGGVVLSAANDNFTAAPDTVANAQALIESLQQIEWANSLTGESEPATQQTRNNYIPLWIGMSQEGNGYPNDQILSGLTPLPDEMAIGATWNPTLANQVGQVMGRELSALGVNLYLGPSLDVLETPDPSASGDLGPRAFGGDPYWVGEMGRAYIAGLHTGSGNRMAVIAKHFPGRGSSDRSPEEEVSTVRKSLEQLKQIELAPFFDVTGNAPAAEAAADGLLVSHIRYQGFQANIRATTRPVSFDSQALAQILALPEFADWRSKGGMVVSDDLGTRAVREFYGQPFQARVAARDAFLAGNDLLYLGQILSTDAADNYASVLQTLAFFTQKYSEDPVFAQQVDASLLRILNAKKRVYNEFTFTKVAPSASELENIGKAENLVFEIGRRAATLISPDVQDLASVLPAPPQVRERLVFITDSQVIKQCSTCPEQPSLAIDALEKAILRLYGPEADNQTSTFRMASYSFDHLRQLLQGSSPEFMEADLNRADWIVLCLAGSDNQQVQVIKDFLTARQDLLRNRRLVLFSFGAPYLLGSTDISRFTAYYALYSKQPAFIDVAARLLFEELTPHGSSPVSVPGIGYDLISATMPDPNQIITLSLDLPPPSDQTGTPGVPQPTPMPLFRIGDTIAFRTGMIYDHNGHPVPDGTVVRFSMVLTGEGGGILQQVDAVTQKGIARSSFGLDKPGLLEIKASSEPAVVSEALRMDVSPSGASAVTVVVPVLTQTVVTEPTPVPTQTLDPWVTPEGYPRFNAWLLTVLLLAGGAWLAYWAVSRIQSGREGVRWSLCVLLGGLLAYNYLALGLPGVQNWAALRSGFGILAFTFAGEAAGALAAGLWGRRASASRSQGD